MKTKKVLLMLAVFLGLASSVKAQQLTVDRWQNIGGAI